MNKRILFRFLNFALLAYALIGIAIYYLQDYIFFHPTPLEKTAKYEFTTPFNEVNIPYDENSNINIIQFTADSIPEGVVLYFHGNKENISWYSKYAPEFTKQGYETWMIDYPGFGKSTGKFEEQVLYDWSLLMYKLARKRFSPDSIIIYGKSLGTGIAAQLASIRDTRNLILETPYYDFPSVVRQYAPVYPLNRMIHFKIPTYAFLQNVTAPVTLFHGTSDGVIRYSNSKKLLPYLKKGDELITIKGGSHNDLHDYELFRTKLSEILRRKNSEF